MPCDQWPLLRGRPIIELTLTTALGGQQVVRRLIADTGAGTLRSRVELLLDEHQACRTTDGLDANRTRRPWNLGSVRPFGLRLES